MRIWNLRWPGNSGVAGVWPLAVSGFLANAVFGAFVTYGLFLVALLEDFGGSRAFASGAYSVYPVMFAVGSVLFSRMADRYAPGRVIMFGAALVAVGFGLSSVSTEPWQLYVFFGGVAGLGSGTLWAPPISAVLAGAGANSNRGLAMSIATSGMPFGMLLLPPLTGFLITIYGWRLAFLALGIVCFALTVPALFTMKRGLASANQTPPHSEGSLRRGESASVSDALSSKSFWVFYVVYAANALGFVLILVHLAPFAIDMGFELTSAGLVLALAGVGSIVGRFVFVGSVIRLTEKAVIFITAVFQVLIVMLLLALGTHAAVILAYAFLFGLFYGGVIPQYPLLTQKYFGVKAYSSVFGNLSTAFGLGAFIGPLLGGYIHDVAGSYTLAWVAVAGFFALSAAFSLLLQPPKLRRDANPQIE